ncbi:MAG: AraC family transcriptional regulator [Ruminococcaceae bacterium]|nr:AraC family transcriptional regulator [Oscillospiraceae bacterium]
MSITLSNEAEYTLYRAFVQTWRTKKYSYKNSARMDYGFLYLLNGHITYTFDGQKIEMYSGDIIYLPKGSYYEAEFDISLGEVKNYLVNFDITGGDLCDTKDPVLYYGDKMQVLSGYFKDVVESYSNEGNSLLTRSLFYRLLHTLYSAVEIKNRSEIDGYIAKGAELLEGDYEMSVEDIAKKLHLSRSAFQKRFKSVYGMSPIQYRTVKRIEKAKDYLDTTDMPIKEIADELGFYDLSYFYKIFEKHFDVSPKKYRDNFKMYF